MNIENMLIKDIKPYERNAKKHDETQIRNVMESIKQFGIAQPLVIDKDGVLIIGHCRLIACKRLKMKEVPVVRMNKLAPEQVDKLRLLDYVDVIVQRYIKLKENDEDVYLIRDGKRIDYKDVI